MLALVPQQAFNAFGGVQATIEEEARDRAEVIANSAAGELMSESGQMPLIAVRMGDGKAVIASTSPSIPRSRRWCSAPRRRASPGRW